MRLLLSFKPTNPNMPTTRHHLGTTADFAATDLKDYEITDQHRIAVAKVDGEFHAIYGKCTHYGAPLGKGHLDGCRVVCPWHQACFDAKTGQHLETPGLDSLPGYEIEVDGDDLYVHLPEEWQTQRTPEMAQKTNDDEVYAIVGGGIAAQNAAEGLRQAGFSGRVVMIAAEKHRPYDRTKLSKAFLGGGAKESGLPLRDKAFYEKHDIDLRQGVKVTQADTDTRKLHLSDGSTVTYDKVLFATGGRARELNVPGKDFDGVHLLRKWEDAADLKAAAQAADNIVIVGSSFIGLEAASNLQTKGTIHVVGMDETPFAGVFGEEVGKWIQGLHEAKGIQFHMGRKTEALEGEESVTGVRLDNGETIEADLVVIGIGVQLNTGYLPEAMLEKDKGVKVDTHLRINDHHYAAGDIAHYPDHGRTLRIEHWKVAGQQGKIAALNMAGKATTYDMVPYFWTAQQGTNLRYAGHAEDFDSVEIDGSLSDKNFIAYYLKNGKVYAALGVGNDVKTAAIRERLREGFPTLEELRAAL